MTIDMKRLVDEICAIKGINHEEVQVWVQVDVAGVPHRLPLGSMRMDDKLVLVGEPLPVPDAIIAPVDTGVEDDHVHAWAQVPNLEVWKCVAGGGCPAQVTYARLLEYPTPELEADAMDLLDSVADEDWERVADVVGRIKETRGW